MLTSKEIFRPMGFGLIFVFLTFSSLLLCGTSQAADVSLAWDPPASSPVKVEGYFVYWGAKSGNYIKRVNNGLKTSCDIIGLGDGQTYFFAVTTYGQNFEESTYSNEISINIPVGNQQPVADAGPDQMDFAGSDVLLDGSNSVDPDGDSLSYLWTQTQGPSVRLDDPTAIQPSFKIPDAAPESSTLTFKLTVTDSKGLQSEDLCTVGVDVAPGSGTSVAPDSGTNVAPDSGTNVAPDSGTDVATDSGTDVAPDSGTDVASDSGIDVAPDSGTDVAPDPGGAQDLIGTWLAMDRKCRRGNCSIFTTFRVKNVGDERVTNALIKFYLSRDDVFDSTTDHFIVEDTIRDIQPGSYVKMSLRVDLSKENRRGDSHYYLIAVIDPGNALQEVDEENNIIVSQYINI